MYMSSVYSRKHSACICPLSIIADIPCSCKNLVWSFREIMSMSETTSNYNFASENVSMWSIKQLQKDPLFYFFNAILEVWKQNETDVCDLANPTAFCLSYSRPARTSLIISHSVETKHRPQAHFRPETNGPSTSHSVNPSVKLLLR